MELPANVISPNYLSKNFHKVIINSDLPQIRLHDFRHSSASNLLAQGFSVVQVADWLRHSTPTTTMRFYAHVDKSSKMTIANALNSTLLLDELSGITTHRLDIG